MNKIKQIEKLLEGWKAAGQEAKEKLMGTEELFRQGGIDFGEAALAILNQPSNQEIATGALKCSSCGRKYDSNAWPNAWRCNNCF